MPTHLAQMVLTDFSSPTELDETASTNHEGCIIFSKGRAGKANMLLEKPQRSFSHKLAQERAPYPQQRPVKARSLPTVHRATQKSCCGNLGGHGLCYLFLIAQRGFDCNRNNNAQRTDLPRDELGPTIGGTAVSTTTVHPPLHTQMLVQVSCVSK